MPTLAELAQERQKQEKSSGGFDWEQRKEMDVIVKDSRVIFSRGFFVPSGWFFGASDGKIITGG